MISLLASEKLTITRYDNTGYYDESGNWVDSSSTEFEIDCSVQPFRSSDSQIILPEGKSAKDARIIYTETKLKTVLYRGSKEKADETLIDNLEFEIFFVEDWSRYGLCSDHYKVIAILKDQQTRRL